MVGRRAVTDGRVAVLGGLPGDRRTGVPGSKVGYMPQVRSMDVFGYLWKVNERKDMMAYTGVWS